MKDHLEQSYQDLLKHGSRKQRGEWIVSKYPHKEEHDGNAMKGLLIATLTGIFFFGFIWAMVWLVKHFLR